VANRNPNADPAAADADPATNVASDAGGGAHAHANAGRDARAIAG
jgi:hypothetical protein